MLKPVVFLAALLLGAVSFAGQAKCADCSTKAEACKVEASVQGHACKGDACKECAAKEKHAAAAGHACKGDCGSAAKECCAAGAAAGKACCADKMKDRTITLAWDGELNGPCEETQEKAFWATTEAMLMTSEGGAKPKPMICAPGTHSKLAAKAEGACERSTATKMVKKGEAGCCNAKGEAAKFKVWNGMGYELFGCEDSASQGRTQLLARGLMAGNVQPVVAKNAMVN
jgi:hypothetical protein